MAEQINSVLNALCEKLGIAVEFLYPLMIKQAYVDGITGVLFYLLIIVVVFWLFRTIKKLNIEVDGVNKLSKALNKPEPIGVLIIIVGILSFVSVIVSSFIIPYTISALANPEWYAINELLSQLK